MEVYTCASCGVEFTWSNAKKKYCDRCAHERRMEKARAHNERVRKYKIENCGGEVGWCPIFDHTLSRGMEHIIDIVRKADAEGKSYGHYMADKYSKMGL